MLNIFDYLDAGFKLVKLHQLTSNLKCSCSVDDCSTAGKHPLEKNWQLPSDLPNFEALEQATILDEKNGFYKNCFGVLTDGFLIVDVDKRNGGFESFERLNNVLGIKLQDVCKFIVRTGGGGLHLYFKNESNHRLKKNLKDFKGIDFLSSGSFVVGCGSLHKSGAYYEEYENSLGVKQSIHAIDDVPSCLLSLLKKPEQVINTVEQSSLIDEPASIDEIENLLSYVVNNDLEYSEWLAIGMILKFELGNKGYDIWLKWSESSSKHNPTLMPAKWRSFSRKESAFTIIKLRQMAEAGGYIKPVTFVVDDSDYYVDATLLSDSMAYATESSEYVPVFNQDYKPTSLDDIAIIERKERESYKPARPDIPYMDIKKPVGLVGEIAKYINDCCLYPREYLAVGASFLVVSTCGGFNALDSFAGHTKPNVMFFCVAGSGTGKNSIFNAVQRLLSDVGLSSCVAGKIKSEQELGRNIIRNAVNAYVLDEVGYLLKKLTASKNQPSFLTGVLAEIMTIYCQSNPDGIYSPSGDIPEHLINMLAKQICEILDSLDDDKLTAIAKTVLEIKKQDAEETRNELIKFGGFKSPFLSLIGFTTPDTFQSVMTKEYADDGFIARSIILEEKDDNPRHKDNFKRPTAIPANISNSLISLIQNGSYSAHDQGYGIRIKPRGQLNEIKDEPDALQLLNELREYCWSLTEWHKENTGLTAILRRSFEMIVKISAILAIGNRHVRTLEHVHYAFNLVEHDLSIKTAKLESNISSGDKGNDLISKVLAITSDSVPMSLYEIQRKGINKNELEPIINKLIANGLLIEAPIVVKGKGRTTKRYLKTLII